MKKSVRTITVREGNKVTYHGPDKRYAGEDYQSTALGIPISNWIQWAGWIGAFISAVYGASVYINDERHAIIDIQIEQKNNFNSIQKSIDYMKMGQKKTQALIQYLTEWTQNSDLWNSAHYGKKFKDGAPDNIK